jgi:thymidylate synthase (FAD)
MTNQSDILNSHNYKSILDHGFIGLVDTMPAINLNCRHDVMAPGDAAIVQAARTSYGKGTKKVSEDRALIRYLMRHKHTTPFEMVDTKWHGKMPIISARQWIRHRTASVNEYSGRYSEMTDEFYFPDPSVLQPQSTDNKQGRSGEFTDTEKRIILAEMQHVSETAYNSYKGMLKMGVAKELARSVLPVSNYTEWYWKTNLHNLFHFLKLRLDSHAQYEIRVYAQAMLEMVRPLAPIAVEAFEDYILNGVTFSREEMKVIKHWIGDVDLGCLTELQDYGWSKREIDEFAAKLK